MTPAVFSMNGSLSQNSAPSVVEPPMLTYLPRGYLPQRLNMKHHKTWVTSKPNPQTIISVQTTRCSTYTQVGPAGGNVET